ncbi:MAG: DUF1259 domain-containing protein [Woeseia sp.]
MKVKLFQILAFSCVLIDLVSVVLAADAETLDAEAIGKAAASEATVAVDGAVRIGWSRDDVPVTVDGVAFPPAAGLGSWAAFKTLPSGGVMAMGDTVVFEDEISSAMDAAFANDLEVTALHNHFAFDRPPVYFMHIGGHGENGATLAKGVKAMWDAIKAVRKKTPKPASRFAGEPPEITGEYDVAALEAILETKGSLNAKVLKFTFQREASMHGASFGAAMGLSTWVAFSGNRERAAVDGDFAMTADEVQPVMHALRDAGIHIIALHNHMIGETPPYYFLHYWGKGNPLQLARGLYGALRAQERAGKAAD